MKKTFDSMNHAFFIAALKKYGFGNNFIGWIKVLLKNQESCVINGGHTTKYFKLERELLKGIQCQHIFLLLRWKYFSNEKSNKNIHGLKIFDHEYYIPRMRTI